MAGSQTRERARLDAEGSAAGAKKAIQGICNAEGRDHAEESIKTVAQLYGAEFPKAALAMVCKLVESAQQR